LDENPPLRYGIEAGLGGVLILSLIAAYFALQALISGKIGEVFAIALTLIQASVGAIYLGGVVATFSFVNWGASEDTRWVWLPLFEADGELYKPLYSCLFELMLRGLLSNEGRKVQTAVVIDELGALNKLQSLSRLGAEARKFGGSLILGTQALAQIKKTYGEEDAQIIQTCTKTKLILNCPDPETAEHFSKAIGSREQIDVTESQSYQTPLSVLPQKTKTQQIREVRAVMPSELQSLPSLSGYLAIADGSPPAKVQLQPLCYPKAAQRLVPRPKPAGVEVSVSQARLNLPKEKPAEPKF
jgi:type IV secretory pathway TraG/TraD family ATPase VirD4